jgi:hypothetical protein
MNLTRLAGFALLVVATACSDSTGPTRRITDLERARARWRAQNLHTYAFRLQRSCFCANVDPLFVAVVDDHVVGVLDLETGEYVDTRWGETVDDLFSFVETAIDQQAAVIEVRYDVVKGFPAEINYDGAAGIADDELRLSADDVHPITPQR